MRELFLEYLEMYCPHLWVDSTFDGTIINLICDCYDYSDVYDYGLEYGGTFSLPETIDETLKEIAHEQGYKITEFFKDGKMFSEFIKEKKNKK